MNVSITLFLSLYNGLHQVWHEAFRIKKSVSTIAGWSSPVARWGHIPKVVGSNPTPAI